jgi:hypothetical protein
MTTAEYFTAHLGGTVVARARWAVSERNTAAYTTVYAKSSLAPAAAIAVIRRAA